MSLAPAAEPYYAAVPDARDGQRVGVLLSHVDHVVDPSSGAVIRGTVSSRDLTERMLENSYHVATLDHDAPTIFAESAQFVRRVTGP